MSEEFAIRAEGLGRKYRRRWVVRGLDLNVPQGSVFGFLGLNGAGKSTTIRMLNGLIRRHEGDVSVLGLDPARQGVEVRSRVGYVAEQPDFYPWMKVSELCEFVRAYRRDRWDPARCEELLDRFELPRDGKIRELSKGQKARTALVLAMAFEPELLVLDEPTSGLDPLARREFIEGVLAEYQQSGRTILVSSHLINEIAGLVDHVGIIYEGRLAWAGPTEALLDSVRRVHLTFEQDAPAKIECEGMLRFRASGREAVLSVRGGAEPDLRASLARFNPKAVEFEALNLEEAFIEFIAGERARS